MAIAGAKISRRSIFAFALSVSLLAVGVAQAEKVNLANGIAIQGYDPVAYFTQQNAVKGDAAISAEFEGSTYYFASADNRAAFLADPSKFTPQYGGYCAFAVSYGDLAPIDPQAFSVVEGKLYLNYSKAIRERWSQDASGNIATGNRNWPKLSAR